MNQLLKEILSSNSIKLPSGETKELHSNVSTDEGHFLQEIILSTKPQMSLEVGLAYGISTLFMCEALEKVGCQKHIAIDPNQYDDNWEGIGMHNLKIAGYEKLVDLICKPSFQALPNLLEQGYKFDFAFIDGWHTFDYTLVDFFYINKLLNIGGVVAFDDADWPAVRKVCRYLTTLPSYEIMAEKITPKFSMKRKLLTRLVNSSTKLKNICKPEFLIPDTELGLRGSCVAFKKIGEDPRRWDFHQQF